MSNITNNDSYGRYYLDEEKYFLIDNSTGTTYYEQDLTDIVGAKIISWECSKSLESNIKDR